MIDPMHRSVIGMVSVVALLMAACSDDDSPSASSAPASPTIDATAETVDEPTTTKAASTSFATRPGPEQIAIVGAEPGDELHIADLDGNDVASGTADERGSLLFRDLEPGKYVVESSGASTGVVTVTSPDEPPDRRVYTEQEIEPGFGYLKMRDGTTLSVNVVVPDGEGPFPTVIEYSGYEPSNPESLGFSQLFTAMGYAYVGVNMRGTGCSGGSYRFFEAVQNTDGYDAIETVAAQDWVRGGKVGMVGISYPGISQLFVAQTQPPSLAAITPLSVISDSFRDVLYPGGILNEGFAVEWAGDRVAQARPEGQEWAAARIADGDEKCALNQELRSQNPDLVQEIADNPSYPPDLGDSLAPTTFVDRVDVPVFIAGAWQDEQTGGRFATMLDDFDSSPHLYASLLNGLHTESLSAGVIPRLLEFLSFYVAGEVPDLEFIRDAGGLLANTIFGTDDVVVPDDDRFRGMTYDAALDKFEAEPPIEVLFEEGAAAGHEQRSPNPRFKRMFDSWPIPTVRPTRWHLGAGTLTNTPPAEGGSTAYIADPEALPATFHRGDMGAIWTPEVRWNWRQNPEGTAASYVSEPLARTTTFIGSASADLTIAVDDTDTDLEVTLSEIRPDGDEVYIQSGWLRASHRALDTEASTELQPVQTHLDGDVEPLTAGEPTPVRVEIFPFAQVVRQGSRLRLTVDAPGNSRAQWTFDTIGHGEHVDVFHGPDHPSSIVLPVVPDVEVPASRPACDALKGQPCRAAPTGP